MNTVRIGSIVGFILNVQVGHHLTEVGEGIVIGIGIDVREIFVRVAFHEAGVVSA